MLKFYTLYYNYLDCNIFRYCQRSKNHLIKWEVVDKGGAHFYTYIWNVLSSSWYFFQRFRKVLFFKSLKYLTTHLLNHSARPMIDSYHAVDSDELLRRGGPRRKLYTAHSCAILLLAQSVTVHVYQHLRQEKELRDQLLHSKQHRIKKGR